LVAIADSDRLVRIEIALAISTMTSARFSPAAPTTKPTRRKRMMPRIVNTLGVKTPAKVPSFPRVGLNEAVRPELRSSADMRNGSYRIATARER
jgi:hypothetical protein